jgi:Icc-related predicted phosphoesterase
LERFLRNYFSLGGMKFLIIGDLHGNKPKIHFKDFDAIITPGDFCSDKELRPYLNKWFKHVNDPKTKVRIYSDDFIKKDVGIKKWNQIQRTSLENGRKILKFLNSFGKPVFVIPGNWDQSWGDTKIKDRGLNNYNSGKSALDYMLGKEINMTLTKELKNIYDCQFKLFKFEEFNILGYGLDNFPEKNMLKKGRNSKETRKLKYAYFKIFERLKNQYKKRDKQKPTIFLSHNVPFGTKLDIILNKSSPLHKKHYGSNIAREFCIKHKPLVCIGGHIHEHFGKDRIGKTICVNSGFGPDVNILLEIDKGKIKQLKFYKGK